MVSPRHSKLSHLDIHCSIWWLEVMHWSDAKLTQEHLIMKSRPPLHDSHFRFCLTTFCVCYHGYDYFNWYCILNYGDDNSSETNHHWHESNQVLLPNMINELFAIISWEVFEVGVWTVQWKSSIHNVGYIMMKMDTLLIQICLREENATISTIFAWF